MSTDYNPIWDDAGNLRVGCTLRTAVYWLLAGGNRSPRDMIAVNGNLINLDRAKRLPVKDLDSEIKRLHSLYYGTLAFDI